MWTFLAALAGGLIALLGSVGTTLFVQWQAIKAERRARVTRAADEILAAVTALRELPGNPAPDSSDPADINRRNEWSKKKSSLIYRITAQAALVPQPDFRKRIKSAADTMTFAVFIENTQEFNENRVRYVLCTEILDCLGAFFQGKPLPPERKATTRTREALQQVIDLENIE